MLLEVWTVFINGIETLHEAYKIVFQQSDGKKQSGINFYSSCFVITNLRQLTASCASIGTKTFEFTDVIKNQGDHSSRILATQTIPGRRQKSFGTDLGQKTINDTLQSNENSSTATKSRLEDAMEIGIIFVNIFCTL